MTAGTVVVLGSIGRNFGAGMTGGVAYVLDVGDHLETRFNPDTVEAGMVRDIGSAATLRELVQRHAEVTGSVRARELLDDWQNALRRFRVVRPRGAVVPDRRTEEAHAVERAPKADRAARGSGIVGGLWRLGRARRPSQASTPLPANMDARAARED
jgi:glutamate synthase domain-containing protein 3